MKRSEFTVLSLLGMIAATTAKVRASAKYEVLSPAAEPLKTAFNRDAAKTRVLMLVSPTCGECLRGSSEVRKSLSDQLGNPDLSVFVVWVPELGAKERHVSAAATFIESPQVSQYWDPSEGVSKAYGQLLSTPGVAWDVYFLFPPGVKWTRNVPKPPFWMQQLSGVKNAPHLDASIFADEVKRTRSAHRKVT
jgi:hypothetical protein